MTKLAGMRIKTILAISLLLAALSPLVLMAVLAPASVDNAKFNYLLTIGVLTAMGISALLSYGVGQFLFETAIKNIRDFCNQVKRGKYDGFDNLPNQGWENADENEFVALMRDMNWMAHLIEVRERELHEAVDKLKSAKNKLRETNEILSEMAITDSLTSLYNRRHFFHNLELECSKVNDNQGPISLIMVDIDHFKLVNDTYGHQTGDAVLIEISHIMKKLVREGDLLARIGGEEFAIVLPGTGKSEMILVANRIREMVESYTFHDAEGNKFKVTCSLGGVAMDTYCDEAVDKICKIADMALYAAKRQGRNRVCYYERIGREDADAEPDEDPLLECL
jgi:diguanylate cyclase (GGDEF)-like protein